MRCVTPLVREDPAGRLLDCDCWAVLSAEYPVPSRYKLYKGGFPGWAPSSYTVLSTYIRGGNVTSSQSTITEPRLWSLCSLHFSSSIQWDFSFIPPSFTVIIFHFHWNIIKQIYICPPGGINDIRLMMLQKDEIKTQDEAQCGPSTPPPLCSAGRHSEN